MAITAANLVANVSVSGAASAETELTAMGEASASANEKLKGMATEGLLLVGAALVATAGESVKMAGDFQKSLTQLATTAGESTDKLGMVSAGLLKMSVDTGTSTTELTQGMYMVESANFHAADALTVMTAAAQGAKQENADLGVTATALTTVMTDYGMKAGSATNAMNGLIKSVSLGKMHLEDISASMGAVLPVAAALNISFPQVAAAISVMTNAGMPAQQASQNLANAIRALGAPSAIAVTSMESVGIKAQQLKDVLSKQGLAAAIELVSDQVGKKFPAGSVESVKAFENIMGGATGYNVALMLGGASMAKYKSDITQITDAMKQGGSAIDGWSNVQNNFNFKIDQAKMAVQAFMIGIGTLLIPILGRIVDKITPVISSLSAWAISGHAASDMVNFLHNNLNSIIPVLSGIAAIILTLLVPAIWSLAAGVIAATWPFVLIGLAVAGLVAIFMHFYQTSAPFRLILADIGKAFAALVPVFLQIGSLLMANLMPAWKQLQAALIPLQPALEIIGKILGGVLVVAIGILLGVVVGLAKGIAESVGGIVTIFRGLVTLATGMFNVLGGVIMFFIDLFSGNFGKLGGDLKTIWTGIIQMFSGSWTIIVGVFQTAFGFIHGLVSGFVAGVIAFFNSLSNSLVGHSIIPDMINSIISYFTQLPGRAITAVQGLASSLGGFFNNLAGQALSWGSHIIGNLISGIQNMAGSLASTVSGIASQIANVLGHTKPKEGPLANDDEWMPHMMEQFRKGIADNTGKIKGVSLDVASTISTIGNPSSSTSMQGVSSLASQGQMQISLQAPDIYLDSRLLTRGIMPQVVQQVRTATGVRI